MKEHPITFRAPMVRAILEGRKTQTRRVAKVSSDDCKSGFITPVAGFVPRTIVEHIKYCPYGTPGDILWVREAYLYDDSWDEPIYRADGERDLPTGLRWRPSIHMPREACRIMLEITEVRVERLNDISGPDCLAEGITHDSDKYGSVTHTYRELWESINGVGSWDLNPWVWVISFVKVT